MNKKDVLYCKLMLLSGKFRHGASVTRNFPDSTRKPCFAPTNAVQLLFSGEQQLQEKKKTSSATHLS